MIHFNIAQQLLLGGGALSQIGAYCLFTKECARARLVEAAQREREMAQAQAARQEEAAQARAERPVMPKIVRYRRQVEGVMEHVADDVRPADLARTAKVRFKHTLAAYQGETQTMPSIRRDAAPVGR